MTSLLGKLSLCLIWLLPTILCGFTGSWSPQTNDIEKQNKYINISCTQLRLSTTNNKLQLYYPVNTLPVRTVYQRPPPVKAWLLWSDCCFLVLFVSVFCCVSCHDWVVDSNGNCCSIVTIKVVHKMLAAVVVIRDIVVSIANNTLKECLKTDKQTTCIIIISCKWVVYCTYFP